MSEGSKDSGEKTEQPSQARIDEYRKKGEVASSKELSSVLTLCASLLTLLLSAVYMIEVLSEFIEWLYGLNMAEAYTEKALKTILTKTMFTAFKCVLPVMISAFCIGILVYVAQIGFLFSPNVLKVDFKKVNPIKGAQKFMSIKPFIEALKGVFKFAVILSITYVVFSGHLKTFAGFLHVDSAQAFLYGKSLLAELSFSILMGLLVVALADFAWVRYSYNKKLKMTKQEVKKEMKEKEGNPEVKQRIRTIQREMAQRRMLDDVRDADVIITNPTHISIAIKYDMEKMLAPEVLGKGADHLAMRMREIAKEHNIPMVENVPLARTIYKTVESGTAVPRTLYKAVAEILAFVYKLKKKRKALSSGPVLR